MHEHPTSKTVTVLFYLHNLKKAGIDSERNHLTDIWNRSTDRAWVYRLAFEGAEEETAEADSAPTDVEIVTTDDGDYELVDQSGKVLISDEDVSNMGVSDIISMYFTRDGKYVIADTGSMLYDEDELPIGGNVLFDLEGNVKRSNDYESISYGGDNGWLCVHNKKTNQTVYLNSDLKTELDLGDAYGAAGDFKKCLRRQ